MRWLLNQDPYHHGDVDYIFVKNRVFFLASVPCFTYQSAPSSWVDLFLVKIYTYYNIKQDIQSRLLTFKLKQCSLFVFAASCLAFHGDCFICCNHSLSIVFDDFFRSLFDSFSHCLRVQRCDPARHSVNCKIEWWFARQPNCVCFNCRPAPHVHSIYIHKTHTYIYIYIWASWRKTLSLTICCLMNQERKIAVMLVFHFLLMIGLMWKKRNIYFVKQNFFVRVCYYSFESCSKFFKV